MTDSDLPFVTCLTSASLDGSTVGPYYHSPAAVKPKEIFFKYSNSLECRMSIMGANSAAKFWTDGFMKEKLPETKEHFPREPYLAPTEAEYFFAIIDIDGTLSYHRNIVYKQDDLIDKSKMRRYHPVEILAENRVSDAYLAYLRKCGISYIFAGRDEFDAGLCMRELKRLFRADHILDLSGGIGNYSLLKAGVISEFDLIVMPYTDGARGAVKTFDRFPDDKSDLTVFGFRLIDARAIGADCVLLRYQPDNALVKGDNK